MLFSWPKFAPSGNITSGKCKGLFVDDLRINNGHSKRTIFSYGLKNASNMPAVTNHFLKWFSIAMLLMIWNVGSPERILSSAKMQ